MPVTDFDTPLHLNQSITAPGGQGTLTNLDAFIQGNRIQIDGRATASGTGWSAVSTFTFFVSLSIDATGSIAISTTTPTVHTDVDLEWWVWLVGLGLGALFGGIIGVIVAAVLLAITQSVVDGVADGLISSGISSSLGSFSSIPLGPIGSGLAMTSLVLDDLELRGSIVRAITVPVRNSGTISTAGGRSFDLDAGTSSATPLPGTDLVWDPATGLTTHGAARLSITGRTYESLDPLAISQLALASTHVPAVDDPDVRELRLLHHGQPGRPRGPHRGGPTREVSSLDRCVHVPARARVGDLRQPDPAPGPDPTVGGPGARSGRRVHHRRLLALHALRGRRGVE